MSVSYVYMDGSANRYSIKPNLLKYSGVKPENSSSGTYDGGPSWEKVLTEASFESIKKEIEALIANTKLHTTKRMMGTGRVLRFDDVDKENAGSWTIVNSSPKRDLEKFLKTFNSK